ncbi:hypothetical protein [Streptacidiphilus neutrinimicus]|uniref:hypothetical protein n=1 Tax=Streptacidiphilus neutrinimicus TaxID=105420 RepID=UPI0005A875FB|nr:hypothetical protein [Streptacidiphilus neutrinimicus]
MQETTAGHLVNNAQIARAQHVEIVRQTAHAVYAFGHTIEYRRAVAWEPVASLAAGPVARRSGPTLSTRRP